MTKITIGTRGSHLALWQAHFVQDQLAKIGVEAELQIIKTKGDQIQNLSFDKIEGKGFFTKEIEDALIHGEVDLAVHSMKDLPTQKVEGLKVAAVSYRENPSDWLLVRKDRLQDDQTLRLPKGAVVGTSSARRKAQLLHFRPDLQLEDLRGNVPTRIQKLRDGQYDAIMLAAAGLTRLELDLSDLECVNLSPREFVPAPAQGVLALQIRSEDRSLYNLIQKLHHPKVARCTNIERRVLQLCEGGCHLPLGVYCELDAMGNYHVWAIKSDTWDAPLKRVQLSSATRAGLAEKVFELLS